jgi:hypothetical protein
LARIPHFNYAENSLPGQTIGTRCFQIEGCQAESRFDKTVSWPQKEASRGETPRIANQEEGNVTMKGHEFTPDDASSADAVAAIGEDIPETGANPRARRVTKADVDWHRAETERLRVLVDFLARPICAHGGAEPDPDIVTAYNLAVEAALRGIRQAVLGRS